jgi:hypothetical protein
LEAEVSDDFDPARDAVADDDFDPTRDAVADDEKQTGPAPDAIRSATLGASQYGTFGFADEIGQKVADYLERSGAYGTRARPGANASPEQRALAASTPTLGENVKADMRAEAASAADAHPFAYHGAGLATSLVAPGAGSFATGPVGVVASGAVQGALTGAGASEAADPLEVAQDAALGGLVGAGATAAIHGVTEAPGAVRNWLGDEAANARAQGVASNAAALQAAEDSARGGVGGRVQVGNRIVENMDRLAPNMTPGDAARMQGYEAAGVLPELRNKLAASNLDALPGAVGQIEDAERQYAAAQAANTPQQAEKMFAGQVAGVPKAIAGAYAQGAKNSAIAHGINFIANWVPGLPNGARSAIGAASTPQGIFKIATLAAKGLAPADALGRFAQPLLAAAARGPEVLASAIYLLNQRDPEFRKLSTDATSNR